MIHKTKTKIKIKTMDQLHHHLSNKSSWYAAWHKEPTAQTFHWFAFGVIVLFAGVLLVNSINPFLSGLSSHAAANDPARVLVVYNAAYTGDDDHDGTQDSLQVANYYMQKRGVPASNLLGLNFSNLSGGNFQSFADFKSQMIQPIQSKLTSLGVTNIDVILFSYRVPWKVPGPSNYGTDYSVDNAIMGLNYWGSGLTGSYAQNNPYFEISPTFGSDKGHFDHTFKFNNTNMYLVSRLDGPAGVTTIMDMVDQSLYAERYLVAQSGYYNGNVYVDSTGANGATFYTDTTLSNSPNVQSGSYSSTQAADANISFTEHYVHDLGLKWQFTGDNVLIGDPGAMFGDGTSAEAAPNALFYSGWYSFGRYNDVYQWLPGSVGMDLDSLSLNYDIRSTHVPAWGVQALAHGASAVVGVVAEPFLTAHPRPNILMYYLLNGYSFAEASSLSTTTIGWRGLNIGDPLYTPFKPKTAVMDTQTPTFAPGYPRLYQSLADGNVIDVMANDSPEPEVMKVTVNYGTDTSYGSTYTSPFYQRRQTFALTDVPGGTTLHYKVTMTDPAGNSTSSGDLTMVTPAQGPYGGTAWAIPGTIEFENFDLGGEGVAYHDSEPTNYNPTYQFRNETGVETLTDQGITDVWFVYPKEYLEYTVNVAQSGNYNFTETAYLDSPQTMEGGRFHIEVDGVNKSGSVHIPGAAAYGWNTFTQTGINLPAGQHVLRFYMEMGSNNDNQVFGKLTPFDKFSVVYAGSGTGDTTAPTVSVAAPTAGQTLSGTVTLSANASDNVGVAGVQFKVDNNNVGTEDTTAPYSMAWSSSTVADGSHQISAVARDAAGNVSSATPVSVTISNTQSPINLNLSPTSLSFAAVSGGATPAAQSIIVSNPSSTGGENWTATTNQAWCHVTPASGFLGTNSNANLSLSVDAPSNVGTFNCTVTVSSAEAANSPQTAAITYTVTSSTDTVPPTVVLTAPANGATVSGTVAMSATATDNVIVDIVYFFIDDAYAGADTTAPYTFSWNSTLAANGTHKVVAYGWDKSGNRGDSAFATITVSNGGTSLKSHLSLSSTSVSFGPVVSGDPAPAAKTVNLANTGTASSSWTSSASQNWCHLTPASGSLAPSGSASLSVSVDAPSNVGTFSCNISLVDANADNSPQSINVSYTVNSATPSATPVITSYSASASGSSGTITWTTDQSTTGVIRYGSTSNNLNLSVSDSVLSTTHSKTITGLASKTVYYYQITATNASGGSTSTIVSSFRTKPR